MASVVDAMAGVDHAPGAARRRRERRLRAYLRYARMSVAMALAEATHHTAPRGQRTARTREEEREVHYTAAFRTTVPPPELELFDLFEEPGGGPTCCCSRRGHSRGSSGTPRCTSSTSCRTCRFSMCLCRSWGTKCGIHADARHCDPRAGYRSAQALS